MSLLEKFGAEQGERHPGPLTWPGSGLGLPILGHVAPNIRQDEFEGIDHKCTYRVGEFRSWVPEEMQQYLWVQDRANNVGAGGVTWFAIRQYERVRDPKGRGWVLWLEWVQVYGVLPKDMMAGSGRDAIKSFIQRNREAEFLGGGPIEVNPGIESWSREEEPPPLHPGPEAWSPTPAGVEAYFDPFAPRREEHGRT